MTHFQSARWTDGGHTLVEAVRTDGHTVFVPADPQNRDYRLLVEGCPEANGQPAIPPLEILPHTQS